jgi:hypothetical protein
MQNEHIFTTQEIPPPPPKGEQSWKKILLIISLIIIVIGFGIGSFYLGKQSVESDSEPTPTSALDNLLTPSPFDALATIAPAATTSATPTKKAGTTSTPTATPITKSKILKATPGLDGFRSSNGGGNNSVDIRAGRNENLVTRGFVSFDIDEIPEGATITEVSLKLYQVRVIGNPYSTGGVLEVDHLIYGDTLEDSDYSTAALLSGFATLSENKTTGWKETVVTNAVKDDIANARSKSQFRIHFEIEVKGGDVAGDFTYFESADNSEGTGNIPQLIVKYH